jgi:hypothetical protein
MYCSIPLCPINVVLNVNISICFRSMRPAGYFVKTRSPIIIKMKLLFFQEVHVYN